ncbi:DUF6114 domain-containing protein [Actinosynnema sp. NPDC020468]|uniref:DUF6114 domain-containing protein n=1 Tax=Actinosynnema sp. NPDC020468 TaxID=3154488 RepID=UPI0033DA3228
MRQAFARWRRTRPFWGGLLILLGAAPILVVPLMAIQVVLGGGTGGVSGVLLGSILVVLGLSAWFTPATRVIAGVIAALVGLAAFPLSNLGGFFVGTLFAVIGGAMTASWGAPRARKATTAAALVLVCGSAFASAPPARADVPTAPTATEITVSAGAGWVGGLVYAGNESLPLRTAAGGTRTVEVMHFVLDEFTVHSDLTLRATAANGVTVTLVQEAAPFTDNASFKAVGGDKVDLYLTKLTADLITFTPTCHPGAWNPLRCGPLPVILPPPHLEYLFIGMTGYHLRIPHYEPGGRGNPGRLTLSKVVPAAG